MNLQTWQKPYHKLPANNFSKNKASKEKKSFFKHTTSSTIISALLEKYMYYLQYEKNVSPKTIENYSLWLNRFLEFCGDIDIAKVNRMQLLDYRMALHKNGLNVRTINYHIVAIRAFLKFVLKNDIDCISPDKLELAKTPPREVNYLDDKEIGRILAAPLEYTKDDIQQARDFAVLQFLYGTGLRVTELIFLQKKDIKLDSNQFSVVGKWSKLRSVFATKSAIDALRKYLKLRIDTSPYLFISLSRNGFWEHLSRNSIEEIVRKYAKLWGIHKKVTPHTLRHSFATTLIKKWADIRAVQTLLWHASITTTQIYTHVDDKYLQKVHELLDG
jgi:site-specific recombinase XerD